MQEIIKIIKKLEKSIDDLIYEYTDGFGDEKYNKVWTTFWDDLKKAKVLPSQKTGGKDEII